ncbi:MAG: DUF1963 domain-containing protein [Candidatus Sumerlaeia bacterium]|nr:DUF1963 domain-containing protein [Candidatus Sumerlaeia bacterium]
MAIPNMATIRAYRRPAYLLLLRPAETPLDRNVTKFGGLPYLLQHERWPVCTGCHQPMTFMFQTHLRDLPGGLRIGRYDFLTFYYCVNCAPRSSLEGKGFHLELRRTSPHDELQPAHFAFRREELSEPRECAVVFRPFDDLPTGEMLVSVLGTDEAAHADYMKYLEQVRGGNLFASKIGGYPCWIDAEPTMRCRCGLAMKFFAQIGSEEEANLLWGAGGVLYLFHCPHACEPHALCFVIQSE